MRFCGDCGHELFPGAAFCSGCGAKVPQPDPPAAPAAEPTVAPPPPRVVPPPPPPSSAPSGPAFDLEPAVLLRRVVVGNWVGAGVVAGTAVLTAGLLAVVLGLLIKPTDFGVDNTLTLIVVLMTAAFGADLVGSPPDGLLDGTASFGMFPLTITIATLAATVVAFRYVTVRYGDGWAALGDGLRAAFLTGLPLLLLAAVLRTDNEALGGPLRELEASSDDEVVSLGASLVGALFMPMLVVGTVLALTCLLRRDWWSPRVQRVHDWVAAPLAGLTGLVLLLPVAGLIGVVVVLLTGDGADPSGFDSTDWRIFIGTSTAFLANIGFAVVSLGAGVPVGAKGSIEAEGGGETYSDQFSEMHRLGYYTGEGDEPGLWVALGVLPLWVLVAAYLVTRRAGSRGTVLPLLLAWVAAMLVAVPLLSRMASGHGRIHGEVKDRESEVLDGEFYVFGGLGEVDGDVLVGTAGGHAVLLLTLAALAAALVMAALAGALDLERIGRLASSIQSRPGGPPAAGRPPTQPPTQPPPPPPYRPET